jgi:hypothetical protein
MPGRSPQSGRPPQSGPCGPDFETPPKARPSPSAGASELQRDWEVRRDPSEAPHQTGRSYVRIYPPVEEPVSDKR